MTHAAQRLQQRVQPQHGDLAGRLLAMAYDHYSTALVVSVSPRLCLVVIARAYCPATVFYREAYRVTPERLGVDNIIRM